MSGLRVDLRLELSILGVDFGVKNPHFGGGVLGGEVQFGGGFWGEKAPFGGGFRGWILG